MKIVHQHQIPAHVRDPEIPVWFSNLIDGLLRKQPIERLGDTQQVLQLLEQCFQHVCSPNDNPIPDVYY